jgi:SAM-dependent methyltransferase
MIAKRTDIDISRVKAFWELNPVAAEAIEEKPGTAAFFRAFDALRESDECEPYAISDAIHGYSTSRGLKVLDVGCGDGYVLFQYARHGAEVAGVDLTGTAVELSRKRFALGGLSGDFREVDGNSLPFPDNHFDIVCSMGVLHHISNPRPMVDEMLRVLKPGGRLIAMLYDRYSWKNLVLLRLRRLFDPRYRGKTQQEALNMNDGDACPLALVYSRKEAATLFSRFSQLESRLTQLSWRQLFMLPPLVKVAERYLPPSSECWPARWLGWNLNIRAVKPPAQGT